MRKMEKGRSMVEMLGVLAIIGVLSVGGIYGYTVAMNKHKANEVAHAASMLAVLARATNGGEGLSATTGTKTLTGADAGIYTGDVPGCTLTAESQSGDVVTVKVAAASGKTCSVIADVVRMSNDDVKITS